MLSYSYLFSLIGAVTLSLLIFFVNRICTCIVHFFYLTYMR